MKEIRKTFCETCMDDVEFDVTDVEKKGKIKGKEYLYKGKKACCKCCGEEVYVPEVHDCDLRNLYDVYRETNGIVSLEKVRGLTKRYSVGKRVLSLMLGWGEVTYTRFYDGDIPSRQYSEILEKLYDEPEAYLDLLKNNKKLFTKTTAYEKSEKATIELIKTDLQKESKLFATSSYLVYKCCDITALSLQKALYYVQGFYYAFFGSFIFDEDCQAWQHGPVYREIYDHYRNYHYDQLADEIKFDSSYFSASELSIIESVIKNCCCYSGKVLESFTHNETPWLKTRGDLSENSGCDRIINKQLIADYFKKVKNDFNMTDPADIRLYSEKMFETLR